jgi:hypothetical protein
VRDDWIPDSDLPTFYDGHKMSAMEVSEHQVECAFLGLDVNRGPGPNGIAPAILKRLASVVKVPLTFVFILSLNAGCFSWHLEGVFCCSFIQELR